RSPASCVRYPAAKAVKVPQRSRFIVVPGGGRGCFGGPRRGGRRCFGGQRRRLAREHPEPAGIRPARRLEDVHAEIVPMLLVPLVEGPAHATLAGSVVLPRELTRIVEE